MLNSRIKIRRGGSRHFDIIASENEQEPVEGEAEQVEGHHHLDGSLRPEAESLQQVPAQEGSYARARDRYSACKESTQFY